MIWTTYKCKNCEDAKPRAWEEAKKAIFALRDSSFWLQLPREHSMLGGGSSSTSYSITYNNVNRLHSTVRAEIHGQNNQDDINKLY